MKNRSKTLIIALFALITLAFACISIAAASILPGDMNGDSDVNVDDAIYLLRHTFKPDDYPIPQSADVNGDGDVNVDDAIYLLRHTFKPDDYPILSETHEHVLTRYAAKASTCTDDGNVEYWHCSECSKNFADAAAVTELDSVVIEASHLLTHYDANIATCTVSGNVEYWYCSKCEKNYADAEALTELDNVIVTVAHSGGTATCSARAICSTCEQPYGPTADHVFERQEIANNYLASAATCDAPASYFYCCLNCGEAGDDTFTNGNALEHEWSDAVANGDGTHTVVCTNLGCGESHDVNCSGGTASCTMKAICSECNTAYGEEPDHDWDNGTETLAAGCETTGVMTYFCSACGDNKTETIPANGHDYQTTETPATCLENGYVTYDCSICQKSYTVNTDDARGHDFGTQVVSCENGRSCLRNGCNFSEPALEHDYQESEIIPANCTTAQITVYACANDGCEASYNASEGSPLGHNIEGAPLKEYKLVNAANCEYVNVYECIREGCGADVENTAVVERHTYKASIALEATCVSEGQKLYTCSECGDSYTEDIPVNDSHAWDVGVVNGQKKTFTCQANGCGATKTIVDASENQDTNLNSDSLQGSGEVALKDASINLEAIAGEGGAIEGKDINLSAGILSGDELDAAKDSLTEEQLNKLGNSEIYNFTITDNSTNELISNFGEGNYVTVTIPYVLEDGEDVDSIFIWFIDDEGNVAEIEATYANGFVTFQTDHFSYYTVTRLTPAERCAKYGHQERYGAAVLATCDTAGYVPVRCIRCAESWRIDIVEPMGHDLSTVTVSATCEDDGEQTISCSKCDYNVTEVIPATGHDYTESVVPATCAEVGTVTHICACGHSYSESIPKVNHDYEDTIVAPTCGSVGYTEHNCKNCEHSYQDAQTAALDHALQCVFTWAEDHLTATAVVTCNNYCGLVVEATVDALVREYDGGCGSNTTYEYIVQYTYNGQTFTDTYAEEGTSKEHNLKDKYTHNEHEHWIGCRGCGIKHELAEHEWDDGVIISQPTCTKHGRISLTCYCGRVVTEKIDATGHSWSNGGCTDVRVCENCGETDGEPIGHTWVNATCESPKTCSVCGATEGVALEHTWKNATCDTPKTCEVCGITEGEAAGHVFEDGYCIACGRAEDACDHNCDNAETFEFAELGYCNGYINYYVCDCGEYKMVDLYNSRFGCDFDQDYFEDSGVDENGNQWAIQSASCLECGLRIELNIVLIVNSCIEEYNHSYELFSPEGEAVFDFAFSQFDEHHDYIETTLGIADRTCGSDIEVVMCEECGYVAEFIDASEGCNFVNKDEEYEDENGNHTATLSVTCQDCGLYIEYINSLEYKNDCEYIERMTYRATLDDEELFRISFERMYDDHIMTVNYEMLGESCDDGVLVTELCDKCGTTNSYKWYGHIEDLVNFDLSDIGLCGGRAERYGCLACGEITGYYVAWDDCSWSFVGEEDGYKVYSCNYCGGVKHTLYHVGEKDDNCRAYVIDRLQYYLNDALLISIENDYYMTQHNLEYNFEFDGEINCESGVTVYTNCVDCGDSFESYQTDHESYSNYNVDLSAFDICDNHYFQCDECPCGYYKRVYFDTSYCSSCGFRVNIGEENILIDGCAWEKCYYYTVMVNDEEIYFCEANRSTYVEHDFDYSATIDDDAYSITFTCRSCGESFEYEESVYKSYTAILEEHRGEYYYDFAFTPEESGMYIINSQSNSDTYVTLYRIDNGNYYVLSEEDDGGSNGNFCLAEYLNAGETYVYRIRYYIETNSGEIPFTISKGTNYPTGSSECRHNIYYSGICVLPEGHDSCEDGVFTLRMCKCGYVSNILIGYDHVMSITTIYNLSDYGACEGSIEIRSCACGYIANVYDNNGCNWTSKSYNYVDDLGVQHTVQTRTCLDCGFTRVKDYYYVTEGCYVYEYSDYIYSIGGEEIISAHSYSNYTTQHDYTYEFTMNGESCTDGFTYTAVCNKCGESHSGSGSSHNTYNIKSFYFDTCGTRDGYVEINSCACGERQDFYAFYGCSVIWTYNEYIDDDGHIVYVDTYSCQSCGLRCTKSYYSEKIVGECKATNYTTIMLSIGDTLVVNEDIISIDESHDYEITGELVEGAESCEDGVIITYSCVDCGDSYTRSYMYHYEYVKERINLDDYGSVCHGYAEHIGCACGYSNYISLDHVLCDLDSKSTALWIDDAILSGYMGSTSGKYYEYFGYDAYILACAVTNPEQCSFKIRYAYYWLPSDTETCIAYRYCTYQFGYDEETGECLYEITFKTGEREQYHSYVDTDLSETTEEGMYISGTRGDCSICGSYYYIKDCWKNNGYNAWEFYAENTLDNGFNKLYHDFYSHDNFADGYLGDYTPESYYRYIDSNGEEYWSRSQTTYEKIENDSGEAEYKLYTISTNSNGYESINESLRRCYKITTFYGYEEPFWPEVYRLNINGSQWDRWDYTYEDGNICHITEVYTNSNGANTERSYVSHRVWWEDETIIAETCTQDGLRGNRCVACGEGFDVYTVDPIAHQWIKLTDDFYFCAYCGLENANGASGDVVFEDLTEQYGNDENYVVGYWNRNNVEFLYYASIILKTSLADGNNEIILENIEFFELEDVRAIAFAKSAAEEAARKLGYSPEDYDVRFTLVPVGSDGSFDYAITFAPEGDHDADVNAPITDDESRLVFVDTGAYFDIPIEVTVESQWIFTSREFSNTYAYLLDSDGKTIDRDDNDGWDNNFRIDVYLAPGNYTLRVKWSYSNTSGYMHVLAVKVMDLAVHDDHILNGLPINSSEFVENYVDPATGAIHFGTPGIELFADSNFYDIPCGETFDAYFICEYCDEIEGVDPIIDVTAIKIHSCHYYLDRIDEAFYLYFTCEYCGEIMETIEGLTIDDFTFVERVEPDGCAPGYIRYSYTVDSGIVVYYDEYIPGNGHHVLNGMHVDSEEFTAKYVHPETGAIYYGTPGIKLYANSDFYDIPCGETFDAYFICEYCNEIEGADYVIAVTAIKTHSSNYYLDRIDEVFYLYLTCGYCFETETIEELTIDDLTFVERVEPDGCIYGYERYSYTVDSGIVVYYDEYIPSNGHHVLNGMHVDSEEFIAEYVHPETGAIYSDTPGIRPFAGKEFVVGEATPGYYYCEYCRDVIPVYVYGV